MALIKVIDRPDVDYTCYLEKDYDGRVFLHNTVKRYSARVKREMLKVMEIIQNQIRAPLYCIHSLHDIPEHLTKYWSVMGMEPYALELDAQGRTSIVYRKEFMNSGEQ